MFLGRTWVFCVSRVSGVFRISMGHAWLVILVDSSCCLDAEDTDVYSTESMQNKHVWRSEESFWVGGVE